jgi:short-subunit dehydrogenase
VCPGPVETEFLEVSQPLFGRRVPSFLWTDATRVAEDSLDALEAGQRTLVPGGLAIRTAFSGNRVAPSAVSLPIARRLMSRELDRGRSG